jgi:transcriptional regulator of arginine metabolism
MKKSNKITARQEAIRELIRQEPIEDQTTLVQLIKQKYGIDTSQAIVSRDLRTMGVVKRQVKNRMIYEVPTSDASREILRLAIVSVMHNEVLIVINTLPALAAFVGDYLDMQDDPDILGVLAGENTLFITPARSADIAHLYTKICRLLYIPTT